MALQLEIVTPSQRALDVQCDEVRLPGAEGSFGVLPGHTPLLSLLKPGPLFYRAGGEAQTYALGEGFAEVSGDHVRVLVEEAERADQIDLAGAQKQLEAGQQKLAAMKSDDPEYERMRAEVERAASRALIAAKK